MTKQTEMELQQTTTSTPQENKKTVSHPKINPTNQIIPTKTGQKMISKAFGGYSPEEVAVIQSNVAKNTTATELAYFINVCKTMQLNPFNKEVWCYKDNRGNLLIFAGRDGFLAKAQKNHLFNGIRSCEVRLNDEFELDVPNGVIHHRIKKATTKQRGEILGAYAIVFRKEGEPTVEWADMETYDKKGSAWKSHPEEMIKKVAETHALKKAFGISGIQSEYDWNVSEGVAVPSKQKSLYKIEEAKEVSDENN